MWSWTFLLCAIPTGAFSAKDPTLETAWLECSALSHGDHFQGCVGWWESVWERVTRAVQGAHPAVRSPPPRPFSPLESRAPLLVPAGSSVTRAHVGIETSCVQTTCVPPSLLTSYLLSEWRVTGSHLPLLCLSHSRKWNEWRNCSFFT